MTESKAAVSEKFYKNSGNPALMELLDSGASKILDVGCGAGDNARIFRNPNREFFGITLSQLEMEHAQPFMRQCWVADIEDSGLEFLKDLRFDAIIFSHILEHLKNPSAAVSKFLPFLKDGGTILIAVPNIVAWRQRIRFLLGKFEYQSDGVMDHTHLRFFSFHTVDNCLPGENDAIKVVRKCVEGSAPLWVLRRHVFPAALSSWIDRAGCALFPNLFGSQILLKAEKVNRTTAKSSL